MFSKAKAEKVVNPPQNPVVRNKMALPERELLFTTNPRIKPRSKLPKTFTLKVAQGIVWEAKLKYLLIKKRRALPRPPPKKTINKAFITQCSM